jgi:hypothetical protein
MITISILMIGRTMASIKYDNHNNYDVTIHYNWFRVTNYVILSLAKRCGILFRAMIIIFIFSNRDLPFVFAGAS